MQNAVERDFNPPHGKKVQGVIFDGPTITFWLENGPSIVLTVSGRFFSAPYTDDEDIADSEEGVFFGDYEHDDFVYPVEVHFKDTEGVIYERPRQVPECFIVIDVCSSFVLFEDPNGNKVVMIREPYAEWKPLEARVTGRIGHLLFVY